MSVLEPVTEAVGDSAFAGRVAIVTGCGRENGLGYEVARRIVAGGGSVLIADAAEKGVGNVGETDEMLAAGAGLTGLASALDPEGKRAVPMHADLTQPGAGTELVRGAVEAFGRIDILINNAAAPQGADRNPIDKVPDSAFDSLVGVNLYGTFQMCREVIPVMRENAYGRIVNIASVYARKGTSHAALYAMTKAGVIGLTRSIAVELGPDGITANAVCPGFIMTSRVETGMRRRGITSDAEWFEKVGKVPVGRNASPSDIASTVTFLASEASGYVTAQAINVDGGLLGF